MNVACVVLDSTNAYTKGIFINVLSYWQQLMSCSMLAICKAQEKNAKNDFERSIYCTRDQRSNTLSQLVPSTTSSVRIDSTSINLLRFEPSTDIFYWSHEREYSCWSVGSAHIVRWSSSHSSTTKGVSLQSISITKD